MRAIVTGGAASSARTSSTRCSRAATRCTSSTTSRHGKREQRRRQAHARTCTTSASRSTSRSATRPRSSSISPRRRTCASRSRDPVVDAEVNVLGTRQRARGGARRTARAVVFASTGGAIYGECDGRRAEDDAAAGRCRPTGPRSSPAEGYLAAFARALRHCAHVALRFGNVYGPRQDPHGRGRRGRDLPRAARSRRGDARIFGDGEQTRDYVLRRRRRRARCSRRSAARRRRVQRRHRRRDVRQSSCTSSAVRRRHRTRHREHAPAAAGELAPQRARSCPAPRASSAGARRSVSPTGLRADLGSRCAEKD